MEFRAWNGIESIVELDPDQARSLLAPVILVGIKRPSSRDKRIVINLEYSYDFVESAGTILPFRIANCSPLQLMRLEAKLASQTVK